MNKLDPRSSKTFWRVIFAAIFLSLLVNFGVSLFLNKRIFKALEQDVAPSIGQEELELSQSVLVDSILAIVQSYYVDVERVGNANLLRITLNHLALNPDLKVMPAKKGFSLQVRNDPQIFEVRFGDGLSYRGMLSNFLGIAAFLESKLELDQSNTDEKKLNGAEMVLGALLSGLDAHSDLMSPNAYRELKQGTEGAFGGLGVLVGIRDQLLTVIKPLPRSPALRAGIRKNDRILNINGVSTYGSSLDQLVEYMRGAPGTVVDIGLLQEGEMSPKLLSLKREIIKVESASAKVQTFAGKKYLTVEVETFSSRTSDEVLAEIAKFRRQNNGIMPGLVLDLRSNPGGLLEQAIAVSDIFLEKGTIVSTRGRRKEIEYAKKDQNDNSYPMIVLINSESASASEIVAGALQDHGRAVILGEPSFGKGSVQTIFELPGEQALKLTIARYYTPLGRSIQNVGIVPDVWLQPVYNEKDNENLLGMFRYKNEQFLQNHLEAVNSQPSLNANQVYDAAFKSFYLSGLSHRESLDTDNRNDPEMAAALTILGRVNEPYGNALPDEARLASHWLTVAAKDLQAKMQELGRQTAKVMEKKFDIDWSLGKGSNELSLDETEITAEVKELEVEQGDVLEIPWKITNANDQPLRRLSIFCGANLNGLENTEVLVGKVESQSSREGKIKVRIPSYIEPGRLLVNLGFAVDAVPRKLLQNAVAVKVKAKAMAKLRTEITLVDEQGGKLPGVLEANENAKVRIRVFNESNVDAKKTRASLQNLSGKQILIAPEAHSEETVKAGSSRDFLIGVQGASELMSQRLEIGVALESEDLLEPVRSNLAIEGLPTSRGVVGVLSH